MSTAPSDQTIERAVGLSGRAPSLHNSQPWRWVFDGTALRLFSVPARMLHSSDASGRQMLLSCGVALAHLRAAAAAAGWHTEVAYFPDPAHHTHLATVTFEPALIVTDAERDRAEAIEHRHTDRLPFEAPAGWQEFEAVLRMLVESSGAVLTVLPAQARPELARASRLTAALRRYDSAYQAELQWWAGHSLPTTGVPATARISAEERDRVDVGRTLPTVTVEPRRTELAADESTVVVLSSGDKPEDLLRCGEALSTVLLECTVAGYATCPLTHLTELPHSRAVVHELTGRIERPQVLVRIGTVSAAAGPVTPTPRLPLAAILDIHAAHGGDR